MPRSTRLRREPIKPYVPKDGAKPVEIGDEAIRLRASDDKWRGERGDVTGVDDQSVTIRWRASGTIATWPLDTRGKGWQVVANSST